MAIIRVFVDHDADGTIMLLPAYTEQVEELPPSIEVSARNPGQFNLEELKSLLGKFVSIDYPAMKLIKGA